ncbi:hypothetical protein MRS44_018188 [Fusarium solani]|uniref:uncharacterized protein n=1 Tax=Fusarium solani TaxID=169388 RepID=UPI0032C40B2E|nr:hypothetical protein MRS44_018188 [Fusarium solani]
MSPFLLISLLFILVAHAEPYLGDTSAAVTCSKSNDRAENSTLEGLKEVFCGQEKVTQGIILPPGGNIEGTYDIESTSHKFSITWDTRCERKSQLANHQQFSCAWLMQRIWDMCEGQTGHVALGCLFYEYNREARRSCAD